ncbi:hypothetical protein G9A89_018426 [Geosiphon pyriformis]|nr:hypothetical protein G9A89_018426 [Geosiphon pyriformis]
MAMYTNIKIDSHFIKLILDSGLAGSIITRQLIDQLGVKTARKNCLSWKLGLHQMKITEHKPTITASHITKNGMAIQNDKASGITNHVSLVENNCSMKECGMTFLVKKEYATLCANIQSL